MVMPVCLSMLALLLLLVSMPRHFAFAFDVIFAATLLTPPLMLILPRHFQPCHFRRFFFFFFRRRHCLPDDIFRRFSPTLSPRFRRSFKDAVSSPPILLFSHYLPLFARLMLLLSPFLHADA